MSDHLGNTSERCNTCRHWLPPDRRTDFHNLFQGNEVDRLYGKCMLIELANEYEPAPIPPPLAVTKDASDYKATLHTQATFGCVLHEEARAVADD